MATTPDPGRSGPDTVDLPNGRGLDRHGADGYEPDQRDVDLPMEPATAFGVEGYDPDDPWNAVLCVESEDAVTVLPLTPKSLDDLVGALGEIRDAQRMALGVVDPDLAAEEDVAEPGGLRQMARAARLATGSAPVARLWNESVRGRLVIIGVAVLFVALGAVLSFLE